MNKLLLLTILGFSAMFLIGCQPAQDEPSTPSLPSEFELANFVDYEVNDITTDETTTYNITVNKPTPCHDILVEELQREDSTNVYIFVGQTPDSDEVCTQVISPETITGNVDSTNVNFYINNERIE